MPARELLFLLLGLLGALPVVAQPGGQRLSYAGWRLAWADEFNAPRDADSAVLAAHWRFQYPWGRSLGFPESQFYSSKQVQSAPGGVLAFRSRKLVPPRPYQGRELQYESGMLYGYYPNDSLRPNQDNKNTDGFSYGLFEIRCQLPASRNSWPAFWLFGGVPDEVDIFEGNVDFFSNTTHVNGHEYWRPGFPSVGCSCYFYADERRTNLHQSFHTYSMAWLPGELIFYFDGFPIRHETRYQLMGLPMTVIANLAMFLWGSVPADSLLIDYIRVYRPSPAMLTRPAIPYRQPQTEVKSDLLLLPRLSSVGAGADPTPRQRWRLLPPDSSALQLELLENSNPICSSSFALPRGAYWFPPWTINGGYPVVTVAGPPAQPWRWLLTDYLGRSVASGALPADSTLRLSEQKLLPGSYLMHLQAAGQEFRQPLFIIDRAATTQPNPGWVPPPDSTATGGPPPASPASR